jgi:hypothetical protein
MTWRICIFSAIIQPDLKEAYLENITDASYRETSERWVLSPFFFGLANIGRCEVYSGEADSAFWFRFRKQLQ